MFGLTTVGRRDELVQQKRRKRRRMLRERSPSPPVSHSKRTPPPPPPPPQLSTRFTPEEMDRTPELEDKKRFLTMFRLSHVTIQQRRGKGIYSNTQIKPSLGSRYSILHIHGVNKYRGFCITFTLNTGLLCYLPTVLCKYCVSKTTLISERLNCA